MSSHCASPYLTDDEKAALTAALLTIGFGTQMVVTLVTAAARTPAIDGTVGRKSCDRKRT